MDISVIVITYNQCRQYIKECLNSIYSQTLRTDQYEVILIDDCSTSPETINTINTLSKIHSQTRIVVNNKNIGLNLTRKKALNYAKGKYIYYIDGDDLLTRDALETLLLVAKNKNKDIVTGEFYRYNGVSKTYNKQERYYNFVPSNHIEMLKLMLSVQLGSFSMCNCLINKKLLTDDIFEMPERFYHEDQINWPRLLFKCNNFDKVNQQTYYYRWNDGSITSHFTVHHARSIFFAYQEWIYLAKKHDLYDELSPYIIHGISKLINFYTLRALLKNSEPIEKIITTFVIELKKLETTLIIENHKGLRFLNDIKNKEEITKDLIEKIKNRHDIKAPEIKYTPESKLSFGIVPSDIAKELTDKIVFVCDVDYHVKSAVNICKHLSENGINCTILDNSKLIADGKRKSYSEKLHERNIEIIEIASLPYLVDTLSTASLVLCYNDFNMNTRDALELRFLHNKPTVCIVEGISDFKRIDFYETRYLSYRRCETIFLAGANDKSYFLDRNSYIIGMPIIEELAKKHPVFPKSFLAILNVNFTYGCLEDKRKLFIEEAQKAFRKLECNWTISKHPMDNGNYENLPLSRKTQYELIDEGSVFISRFATGIIECLASGKPAIYFNPHGEKVDKFKKPLDAFYIANDATELAEAIIKTQQDISNKVDFRQRAAKFLKEHAALNHDSYSCAERVEKAVSEILNMQSQN